MEEEGSGSRSEEGYLCKRSFLSGSQNGGVSSS